MFQRRSQAGQSEPTPNPFQGVWAAAVTPHRRHGFEADYAGMLELVDKLGRSGVDGIVLLGSTGEFLHIQPAERQRLVHLAVKRSRVPIVVGVGHSTLDAAIQLGEAAVNSNVAGLLLMPPYFYRYSEEQVMEFFRLFALAIGGALPILLYNIPAFANPISLPMVQELLLSGDFAGIKDSSGDAAFFDSLAELRRQIPFALLCGNDRLITHAHHAGCDGIVSGIASAAPELIVALDRALDRRDERRAQELQAHLSVFIEWIERFPVPVGISAAVEARGLKVGPAAIPLTAAQDDALEEFKAWLMNWLPYIEELKNARSSF
jgi:dihydrodipicolinate synthase/N-acetylneuraminate lyase